MKRVDKAARIQTILGDLYPQPHIVAGSSPDGSRVAGSSPDGSRVAGSSSDGSRVAGSSPDGSSHPLAHADPFSLLVAVLLSAQTTDVQVNRVTPGLFALARRAVGSRVAGSCTPAEMVQLGRDRILGAIRSCGLAPTKAANIKALSQILCERHDGLVPSRIEELEALPGVGHKTASVVMSQAFGQPAFPVDTHIHRLAGRWGLSNGSNVARTERDLKKVFPRDRWSSLHLQIIYFGREHCPAQRHDLSGCPICAWAASKKRIRQEAQVVKKRR